MGTLYDCLREARLEKYYPAFRANGITRSESLANLTMPEFCAMGITGSEDRRRLMELVNIIKSVHRGNIGSVGATTGQQRKRQPSPSTHRRSQGSNSPGSHSATQSDKKVPRRHTHSPAEGMRLEVTRDVSVRERGPNFSAASYMDMLECMSDSSRSDSTEYHSQSSDSEPVPQAQAQAQPVNVRGAPSAPLPTFSQKVPRKTAPAEKVRNYKTKGYNYGVPGSRDSVKTRARSASRLTKDERIRVCVRKRPLNRREIRSSEQDIVTAESTTTIVITEPKVAVDLTAFTLKHEFMFDEVFHEDCSNEDVYIRAARPLISTVFLGSNATFFAYGQTGAGKTHTMMGGNGVPGLYQLAAQDIYDIIKSGQHGKDLHIWVSFFEIYCGQLFDLLNRRNRLVAREDASHQVCIAGLTETEVPDVETLIMVLDYGNSVRSRGISGVNPDSSRSHAVLQLEIRRPDDTKLGKVSFIDLAGSERASDMPDADRQTRIEGAEINQSLLALKECIRSIDQESRHTPFRQSKLTHILKDAFVGSSRTCMIANLAPNQTACEHTLNTLRYADRVKELRRESGQGAGTSSSIGQAMNLLMNIPLNAPSIFHPSNVLSTSTPVRPHPSRAHHTPVPAADVTFNPSETPIRGHHVRSKPMPKSLFRVQQPGGSPSSNRVSKPRWQGSWQPRTGSPLEAAASQAAPVPHPEASPSESEQTDTDSCNVTHPTETRPHPTQPNIPVIRSTDTEFDFPTSDFNNIDEQLNDLNQGGDKARAGKSDGKNQKTWTDSAEGKHKGSRGLAKDDRSSPTSANSSDTAKARAVVAKSVSKTTPTSTAGGAKNQSKNSHSTVRRQSSGSTQASVSRQNSLSPTPSSRAVKHFSKRTSAGSATGADRCDSPASQSQLERQRDSDSGSFSSQTSKVQQSQAASARLTDSFDDELLFAGPASLDRHQGAQASVMSETNSGAGPVLSKPNKHLMNVQQMNLPAVQTAHSSDLTSIAQRSPLRNGTEKTTEIQGAKVTSQLADSTKQSPRCGDGERVGEANSATGMNQLPQAHSTADTVLGRGNAGAGDTHSPKDLGKGNLPQNTTGTHHPQSVSPRDQDHSQHSLGSLSNHQHTRTGSGKQPISLLPSSPSSDPLMQTSAAVMGAGDSQAQQLFFLSAAQNREAASIKFDVSATDNSPSSSNPPPPSSVTLLVTQKMVTTSAALVTEKLWSGVVFSPIHPQPVSTTGSSVVSTGALRQGSIVQPKPVTGISPPLTTVTSSTAFTAADRDQARMTLVVAHEDQLASITSLCKQEMKLLLNAKKSMQQRSFDEYITRVNNVLAQKMNAIQLLQTQISDYRSRFSGAQATPHPSAAAAASACDSDNNSLPHS